MFKGKYGKKLKYDEKTIRNLKSINRYQVRMSLT